jgi:N-methylhydantoinase B/oxoprolinase/acetone carboxylase alpha subunit
MTNNKQQTAVEWLIEHYTFADLTADSWQMIQQQAKEMEKERIETAYNKGTVHGIDYPESTLPITGEQYYNETYRSNETIQ